MLTWQATKEATGQEETATDTMRNTRGITKLKQCNAQFMQTYLKLGRTTEVEEEVGIETTLSTNQHIKDHLSRLDDTACGNTGGRSPA
jgi:hypothetical protein